MSKQHIAIKNIKNNYKKVFRAGYCDLQHIMRYEEPKYYNSGVYGWNCDIYIDYQYDIAITTGYRNMAGKRIPSEILEKYSEIAKEIVKNQFSKPFAKIDEELTQNRKAFFKELNNL